MGVEYKLGTWYYFLQYSYGLLFCFFCLFVWSTLLFPRFLSQTTEKDKVVWAGPEAFPHRSRLTQRRSTGESCFSSLVCFLVGPHDKRISWQLGSLRNQCGASGSWESRWKSDSKMPVTAAPPSAFLQTALFKIQNLILTLQIISKQLMETWHLTCWLGISFCPWFFQNKRYKSFQLFLIWKLAKLFVLSPTLH